jgi:hypothetical protein
MFILDGLSVRSGNANGSTVDQKQGGGLLVSDPDSAVAIRNCDFESNSATILAGAALLPKASVQILNSTFMMNQAHYSAAVEMGALGRVDGCVFEDNHATAGSFGESILACRDENVAAGVAITRTVFRSNTAGKSALLVLSSGGTANMVNLLFEANTVPVGFPVGLSMAGAVETNGSGAVLTVNISNTAFLSNQASSTIGSYYNSNVYLRNVTAASGSSVNALIENHGTSQVYVYNSILRDISGSSDNGNLNGIAYCATRYSDSGAGNTTANPLLGANGVPAANSPVINAGSNTYLPADVGDIDGDGNTTELLPLDLAGNARVQGGTVDMGAFEVQ